MDRIKKRLAVDIPEVLHRRLVEIAKRRNITLSRLVMRMIYEVIQYEQKLES